MWGQPGGRGLEQASSHTSHCRDGDGSISDYQVVPTQHSVDAKHYIIVKTQVNFMDPDRDQRGPLVVRGPQFENLLSPDLCVHMDKMDDSQSSESESSFIYLLLNHSSVFNS